MGLNAYMKIEEFSNLVLAWNEMAQSPPANEFKGRALDAMRRFLPFSSAWWGIGVRGRKHPKIVQNYLYGLPQEYVADWQDIAEHDAMALDVQARPGVTILSNDIHGGGAQLLALCKRYDVGSTLSTSLGDDNTGIGSFLSVYRDFKSPDFTEDDRQLMQMLIPHLMQAAQNCWRRELLSHLQKSHVAFVDRQLCLIEANVEFCQLLLEELPHWEGRTMPHELAAAIEQKRGHWDGKAIHMQLTHQPDGRTKLELFLRIGCGLSPSQERVAREFAAGFSHKEIARTVGLSPATVRTYLRDCYLKLGVSNKIELGNKMGLPASGDSAMNVSR